MFGLGVNVAFVVIGMLAFFVGLRAYDQVVRPR
jgi:hypothetical protein